MRWLLAVLACALLAVAAARPVAASDGNPVRVVFLVDGSASTAAKVDGGQTAFDTAIRRVRSEAAAIPAHVAVEVVVARGSSLARWSGDAARMLIDPGVPDGSLPTDLGSLASSLAADRTVVWAVGDGQAPFGLPPRGALWTPVGRALPNAALEAVEVEDAWPLLPIGFRIRVVSHAEVDLRGAIRIEGAVVAPVERAFDLASRSTVVMDLRADRVPDGGSVRVVAAVQGDAMAIDDLCELEVPPLPRTAIAVQAEEGGIGFAAAAGKSLAVAVGGSVVEAAPGQQVGFLIAEGGEGAFPPDPGPLLAFGRKREASQPWPAPLVVDWDRGDPVLAGLDLSELEITHALAGTLPPGRILLSAQMPNGSTAPLAVVEEGLRGKAYHFAFRLQDSNLGLLAAFPQLLLRCYEQSQPGPRAVVRRKPGIPASESDLSTIRPSTESANVRWAAHPSDLSAWCVALALVLLALRSGVR